MTALGLGFFLSAMNVRYRDVRYMIPVFLQVLPLALRRHVRRRVDPGEVAVDALAQPDDGGHQRVALGGGRRDRRRIWGQVAVGVAVAVVLFVVGLAVFRSSEPRFADTI